MMTSASNGIHRDKIDTLEKRVHAQFPSAEIFKELQYDDPIHHKHGEIDLLAKIGNYYLIFEVKCNPGHERKAYDQLARAKHFLETYHRGSRAFMLYYHGTKEEKDIIEWIKNGKQ